MEDVCEVCMCDFGLLKRIGMRGNIRSCSRLFIRKTAALSSAKCPLVDSEDIWYSLLSGETEHILEANLRDMG